MANAHKAIIEISVPIRGLFNLTKDLEDESTAELEEQISVPIRGLFNLTGTRIINIVTQKNEQFPSPLGDYLI